MSTSSTLGLLGRPSGVTADLPTVLSSLNHHPSDGHCNEAISTFEFTSIADKQSGESDSNKPLAGHTVSTASATGPITPERVAYFHGHITRDQAEELLLAHGATEGSFLLRESVADNYAVSICHAGRVHHYNVERQKDGTYQIPTGKQFHPSFFPLRPQSHSPHIIIRLDWFEGPKRLNYALNFFRYFSWRNYLCASL
ncbi:unnamed protein product [Protopolystoma xenopodis]|uniref:SH2 domain-containing protein n=1 Tax=Protopolystoma xenopodis TaxID=117903 RepID=A0A3S5AHC2_9PLAT|nr:unnamed protein product [Protopolystoma xenopodis]